jgi:hypothetical protein
MAILIPVAVSEPSSTGRFSVTTAHLFPTLPS